MTRPAYYYFRAKEHLVQAFYERTHEEHLEASREILAGEQDFGARLRGVMSKKVETAMPYHRLGTGVRVFPDRTSLIAGDLRAAPAGPGGQTLHK